MKLNIGKLLGKVAKVAGPLVIGMITAAVQNKITKAADNVAAKLTKKAR